MFRVKNCFATVSIPNDDQEVPCSGEEGDYETESQGDRGTCKPRCQVLPFCSDCTSKLDDGHSLSGVLLFFAADLTGCSFTCTHGAPFRQGHLALSGTDRQLLQVASNSGLCELLTADPSNSEIWPEHRIPLRVRRGTDCLFRRGSSVFVGTKFVAAESAAHVKGFTGDSRIGQSTASCQMLNLRIMLLSS